jgi:hypothetical protein
MNNYHSYYFMVHLGNGERARFWRSRWLDGTRKEDIAPNLTAMVLTGAANVCSVTAVRQHSWYSSSYGRCL